MKILKALHLSVLAGALALGLAAQGPAPQLTLGVPDAIGAEIPDDPELARVIAPLSAQLRAAFGREIGAAPGGIRRDAGPGVRPLGFLVADLMLEAAGGAAQVAVTNSGGLRRDLFPGPVRIGDIYEVLPFENELVLADLTGAELAAVVAEGIRRRGGEPLSGLVATVDGSREAPQVTLSWPDGTPVDPGATIRIATLDYLLATGDATPTLTHARHRVPTGIAQRQLIIDGCARRGSSGKPLEAPADERYHLSGPLAEALAAPAGN